MPATLIYVSSVTYSAVDDKIFYTTDNDRWRDLNSYDLKSGATHRLQKDFRTGDLAFDKTDKSIWGIKHLNGYSTIVQVPRNDEAGSGEYSTWDQVLTLPYGHDIFDIDVSPDGKWLSAAVSDLAGNQSLLLYDIPSLKDGNSKVDTIFNFEVSSPQSFRFSEDGRYLYGSSYYSGVSNLFRVDMKTMDIEALSNVITGLFRPVPVGEDQVFAFEFTSDGFQPVLLDDKIVSDINAIEYLGNITIEKHPELKEWELPISSSSQVDIDEITINEGTYNPWKEIGINYAYPTIVGYKNYAGVGYRFNFSDPLSFRELDFSVSYTPSQWLNKLSDGDTTQSTLEDNEQFHFSFYAKAGRYSMHGSYNGADFYDLFGPTKSSRQGISLQFDYDHSLIWDPPVRLDLNLGAGGFYGLDRSPSFQRITTTGFDNNFFLTADGSLSFRNMTASLGAVDYEKGFKSSIRLFSAFSESELYPGLVANFDFGVQLPGKHFSLWFRSTGGKSFRAPLNPFTRFGFAAFGNNFIDYQTARRYRTSFSFPGISYTSDRIIVAREFAKGMAELVFPPIRFREFGGLNLYSNWMQFMLFSSVLTARDTATENYLNVGSQVDLKIVIFSLLESTLSIGYARAWDTDDFNQPFDEWMISLKLLR